MLGLGDICVLLVTLSFFMAALSSFTKLGKRKRFVFTTSASYFIAAIAVALFDNFNYDWFLTSTAVLLGITGVIWLKIARRVST